MVSTGACARAAMGNAELMATAPSTAAARRVETICRMNARSRAGDTGGRMPALCAHRERNALVQSRTTEQLPPLMGR